MASRGGISVTVRNNRISDLINTLTTNARTQVEAAATEVRDQASRTAPVDTGSLRESIYVSVKGGNSDYLERTAIAKGLNRDVEILEEINPDFVIGLSGSLGDAVVGVVAAAAGHAIFNENGTSRMPARPFLRPAALSGEDIFTQAMTHILDTFR